MKQTFEKDPKPLKDASARNMQLYELLTTIWIDLSIASIERAEEDGSPGWLAKLNEN